MKRMVVCIACAVFFLTGCGTNYIKEANQFLEEQNYTEAAAAFEKAAENEEYVVDATRGLAICLYEQQDYQGARDTFQKVLDIGGEGTPELYNLMGICALRLDDFTGGTILFQAGITAAGIGSGTDAGSEEYAAIVQEMRFNEIVCYEKLQDWENAKVKMQDYAGLYPDDTVAQKEAAFLSTR